MSEKRKCVPVYESVQYNLTRIAYGRRNSFLYVGAWDEEDTQRLYVCALLSGLDTAGPGQEPRCGKLFPIIILRDGKEIPYTATATPVCITVNYEGGSARICLQRDDILRVEATGGVEVLLAPKMAPHEVAKTRGDGSWELLLNPLPKLLFCPVIGEMEATSHYDVITSLSDGTRFSFKPDANGNLDFAVHMYISNAWRMEKYPAFDSIIREIEEEFTAYLATAPKLSADYDKERTLAAFIIWSHILPVDGINLIYMNKGVHRCTSNWQQCFHAMGQFNNPKFAWELILSMFRYQDDYGMLPDMINDATRSFGGTKPPFHGVALNFLKHYTDFEFATIGEVRTLYEGLAKWVYWWLSYRDTDEDEIAQYDAADEAGWDDCSMFRSGVPTESPDLATYLILAMENLSELAGRLGRRYEQREWKARAERMLKTTLEFFWNGEGFTSRINGTHEWVKSGSLATFLPLLLGKRLPQEMIDKMVAALSKEGDWLTPYGLAGERLDSDHYREVGWLAGPVLAPANMLVCLGLHECGEDDLAREIVKRYAKALSDTEFAMIINGKSGKDVSEGRWSTRYPNRMAWTAVAFLVLGSLYL